MKLYKVFREKDATLIEINPLAEVKTGNNPSDIAGMLVSL
jgi:succinyl-CoA synthetase beta subunit